jgi:hypothetical protein
MERRASKKAVDPPVSAGQKSTILHTDFEAETRGILVDALTVIDDHANDHSDTVPMRGDAGDRMLATK